MPHEDQDDLLPVAKDPERKPAKPRRERKTLRECPDSKRELATDTIIALAELELFTR